MHQVKENVENSVQTKKDQHSGPKCAAKFGKVIKFAAAAKSLRTTALWSRQKLRTHCRKNVTTA